MRFYADLHVHSKYSRACSQDSDLEHLAWWAALKGVAVVGTGDFTHPAWAEELRTKLVPAEPGLFRLRSDIEGEVLRRLPAVCRTPVRFLLSTEISTISKRGDRTRKVHHLLFSPDLDGVEEITRRLARVGNLAADGRPILGLDPRDLLEITLAGGPHCSLVPAHVWTPWFSALGSKSGFDSIEECYGDLAGHVFAAETGLSSDPAMNWRVSGLDRYNLVSNSDAHSPPMLGREATVFDVPLDYHAILGAMRTGEGLEATVEFFPEEGKYHLDGHRACGVRLEPERTRELSGRCPTCARPLTVGVLHRVEALADHPEGRRPANAREFQCLISLPQVLGELLDVGPRSKSVAAEVSALVGRLGPEFGILTDVPLEEVGRQGPPLLPEALDRLRRGAVSREAGYDGVYGTIRLFEPGELASAMGPMLFDLPAIERVEPAAPDAVRPAASRPADAPAPLELPLAPPSTGSSVLDGLDPDQRAAAEAGAGPLLIVAGPGTGKTRTLTHLLAHRVRDGGVAPERCLALTFTRRAAAEMRDRLRAVVPGHADRMLVTTFHGLGLRLVREVHERLGLPEDVRVADEETREAVLAEAGADRYHAALHERGLVDLDELVALPLAALEADEALVAEYRRRWTEVCVDEYQDVDETQYRLLRLLCPPGGNLRAIGDPDQAIYGFRGADVGFFLRFNQDFPAARRVQLTRSYRSTPTIVRGALQAIAPAALVPDRELEAVRRDVPDGPIIVHRTAGEQEEAAVVVDAVERLLGGTSLLALDRGEADGWAHPHYGFSDFAVLYRTDAQSRPLAEALARKGFPFQKRSHERLTDRPGVRTVLRPLRERAESAPSVAAALARAVRSALDEATGDQADEILAAAELLGPLAADCGPDLGRFLTELALGAEVDTWDPRADRISLLTLHASKGLEFPVVFVVGCEDGLLPLRWGSREADPAADAEERRLLFVGMTRATTRLVLTSTGRRPPSPFLSDVDPALLDRRTGPPAGRSRETWQLRLL
ncbi:MAG TPA: UvrD-helicase domain-containing protein [Candidatus Dormibacteraeota bacterium]|nr:UvrD-helicase domain-containing protein [Candidatus Dormibacteraeota bacterium]